MFVVLNLGSCKNKAIDLDCFYAVEDWRYINVSQY